MRIEAMRGDITAQPLDAIVNAANATLLGGGGVDGAIHEAAGPLLLEHCRWLRRTSWPAGLPTGEAVATPGFSLHARHVIHTVGPKQWEHPDGGRDLLERCHRRSLAVADDLGLASIAFPAISCGAYGWRPADAAELAVAAVRSVDASVELVRFVLFNDDALSAWRAALAS